jgi:diketogulonate reductase-like aldo/keto reductase
VSRRCLASRRSPLIDGNRIPTVGLGTYSLQGDAGADAVAAAIRAAYRLLDSLQGYENEDAVGEGMRRSGVQRSDLVLTTKLPDDQHGFDETLASFDRSAATLHLDTVDLYLIHWPVPEQDRFVESWRAMIRLREEGRIRSIGVSNFSAEQVDRLGRETGELPAVNQVELRIGLDQGGRGHEFLVRASRMIAHCGRASRGHPHPRRPERSRGDDHRVPSPAPTSTSTSN